MKRKNKESSKDNSLKYFLKLLLIVFFMILLSVGLVFWTFWFIIGL